MIRITNPAQQKRFAAGDPATAGGQEIILDYCAVKSMQLSIAGADIYKHGARVMAVWGRKSTGGEFIAAEPLVSQEFSLANVREEKRTEFFQHPAALVGEGSALPTGSPEGSPTTEKREIVVRPADHALRDLLTPAPDQSNRRFGDVRMRDFEDLLVSSGRIEGVVE